MSGASEVGSSPSPDCLPSGRAVRVRHPRAVGAGVRVSGLALSPRLACPVGAECRGGVGGCPRGGWPATVVRGVWCQALSLPLPPVLWGGQPGFRNPCAPGAVAAGVGTQHQPRIVRSCGPALLALGVAEGRPRGGAVRRCEGRLRSGAPPPPTARPPGGLSGSATHVLWARVCGCGGPARSPWLACSVEAACRGGGGGPSPGGWPATVVRGVWCQAQSLPRPPFLWGGQSGFRDPCVLGAVGEGVGTQHLLDSVRPCGPALHAVGVAEGRNPGRAPFGVVRGVRDQALPLPQLPALWAGCRGPLPTCCGHGCAGVGALHRPRGSRALWRAACHGGGGGRLGSGAPSSLLPRVWVCAVFVVSVRCVSWCVVPPFACPSGAPFSGASVRCCARPLPCVCRAPFPARVPCSAAGYHLFLSWLRRSLLFPLLALLPGMHFIPASALVCVSVFFLAASSFSLIGPCEIKEGWGYVGLRWLGAVFV